ncbi:pyridoxal phosphate-dependent transferase [Microdochium trichocladiopsis]|uniref:Pyridoxal phosphate-dependent transferase n=1 Tax=Microdochium trichocladiopsis TaxID=1682393 RepID=A0A9P8XUI9_9PEZI|nr:pyridoxal phosphate-dependent transferase [Microdochium trichocladiopsis]KAH7018353.1 pyridoxal phosphate-dependent transferase [Microdochium trichocladiopsis]
MSPVNPSSKVPAFAVEQWMDKYETTPNVLNLAETCAASITIEDLVRLNSQKQLAAPPIDYSVPMTYGAIRGSSGLRDHIADLYNSSPRSLHGKFQTLTQKDVIVTTGAISANYLVFYSLVEAGDHVISVYPTYQQLYTVPASLGADVSLWKLDAKRGFVPDVSELEKLIRPNTKMIVINNPNNPTGATIVEEIILSIIAIAKAHGIILFSDEVYAPLFHGLASPADFPRSAVTLASSSDDPQVNYDNIVTTGSMSKAWALAGIRVGWVATRNPTIRGAIASARDYTTISVSQIDDQLARYALSKDVRPQLAQRNIELAKTNLDILAAFVEGPVGREVCDWVKPNAGTTAFIRFFARSGEVQDDGKRIERRPVDDVAFCRDLLDKTKVMFVPGSLCFGEGKDFRGYVRIGYVCHTDVLRGGVAALEDYVRLHLR